MTSFIRLHFNRLIKKRGSNRLLHNFTNIPFAMRLKSRDHKRRSRLWVPFTAFHRYKFSDTSSNFDRNEPLKWTNGSGFFQMNISSAKRY